MAAGGRFYSCYLLPHHGIFGGVGTVIFFGSIDANRNSGHDAISIAPKTSGNPPCTIALSSPTTFLNDDAGVVSRATTDDRQGDRVRVPSLQALHDRM